MQTMNCVVREAGKTRNRQTLDARGADASLVSTEGHILILHLTSLQAWGFLVMCVWLLNWACANRAQNHVLILFYHIYAYQA
jgi:hypothetical protein